jgi:hypothetical protein
VKETVDVVIDSVSSCRFRALGGVSGEAEALCFLRLVEVILLGGESSLRAGHGRFLEEGLGEGCLARLGGMTAEWEGQVFTQCP